MAKYLDNDCTTYDETSHKLVVGRDAIVSDVESKVKEEEEKLKTPSIRFEVDRQLSRFQVTERWSVLC